MQPPSNHPPAFLPASSPFSRRRRPLQGVPRLPSTAPLRSLMAAGWLLLVLALASVAGGCDSPQRTAPAGIPDLSADATLDPTTIPAGRAFDARVAKVLDGDSFDLELPAGSGRRIGIRLAGIDAPERRQPYADVARRQLQALIGDRRIRVHVLGHDRYGRILGQVEVPAPAGQASGDDERGRDVGLAQLEAGLAWYYRRYEQDLPATWRNPYDRAEVDARRQRRGLWREPDPVPPWRYRETRRKGGAAAETGAVSAAAAASRCLTVS